MWFNMFTHLASAKKYYFKDDHVEVIARWLVGVNGLDTIVVDVNPIVPILVENNAGCFSLDTTDALKCTFRNTNCPRYIIKQGISSLYVRKKTKLSYQWVCPVKGPVQSLYLNWSYIPANRIEYEELRSHFTQLPTSMELAIPPENERVLVRSIRLELMLK
jgi:hypothetical protein